MENQTKTDIILDYIKIYHDKNGVYPSYREIAKSVRLKVSTVCYHMDKLKQWNKIEKVPGNGKYRLVGDNHPENGQEIGNDINKIVLTPEEFFTLYRICEGIYLGKTVTIESTSFIGMARLRIYKEGTCMNNSFMVPIYTLSSLEKKELIETDWDTINAVGQEKDTDICIKYPVDEHPIVTILKNTVSLHPYSILVTNKSMEKIVDTGDYSNNNYQVFMVLCDGYREFVNQLR